MVYGSSLSVFLDSLNLLNYNTSERIRFKVNNFELCESNVKILGSQS